MIHTNNCQIKEISAHKVGNKANEEELILSENSLHLEDETLLGLLKQYFLKPFTSDEFYNFTFSNGELEMNPMYAYATSIFEGGISFHENSIKMAQYLFDVSNHPNINSGDLFVVKFNNVRLNEQEVEVIGIFKSENKQSFIQLNGEGEELQIDYDSVGFPFLVRF